MNSTFMRKAAAVTATAGCAVAAAAMTATSPAGAAPLAKATSFVVAQGGTGTDKAVAAVTAAGGTVVQEWPQIGVVIASASDDTFDDKARQSPGIVAAGPSRAMQAYEPASTVPVDGTVQGLGPGTSGGDDTQEPMFANQWHMRQIGADKAHLKTDGNRDITVGVVLNRAEKSGMPSGYGYYARPGQAAAAARPRWSRWLGKKNRGVPHVQ